MPSSCACVSVVYTPVDGYTNMKKIFLLAALFILALWYASQWSVTVGTDTMEPDACRQSPSETEDTLLSVTSRGDGETPSERIAYEIPNIGKQLPEILIHHYSYTISYNPELCIPNWVAWELDATKLVERESRNKHFLPDPNLSEDMAVTTDEYRNSGWDRGHMCPAGDNKYHWRAMDACFYMTNICPQNSNLNRGDWKELEDACRVWAAREPVYIVCGPVMYKRPKYGFIGRRFRIRIPDAFFKVVLTGMHSGHPRAIGFLFKNEAGNRRLDKYVNTVDELERITSIDFFPALPDEIEDSIESQYDMDKWQ